MSANTARKSACATRLSCDKPLVSDADLLCAGGAQGIGHLGGHESDLRLVPANRKHREHLERAAHLRSAEILVEVFGGVDIDCALRQRFSRGVVKSEGE